MIIPMTFTPEDDHLTLAEDAQVPISHGLTDLDALKSLVAMAGTRALSEEEYRLLEEAQRQANFAPGEWHENLLDHVTDIEQGMIAQDIWKWIIWDEASREKWSEREQAGIRMMGVTDEAELPPENLQFSGMSTVVHPGFTQACMEFWARAFTELFPPEGPAKAIVLGQSNDRRTEQAERVAGFINYQYTQKMPGAYDEWSRLLFRLPMSGSMFTKVYYDHEEETARVIAIEPSDFIAPYTIMDLRTAPRYTHRMWTATHIVKGRMESGFYSDKPLVFATEATYPEVRRVIEDAEGREPTMFIEDRRHCILECHCYYAIKTLNRLEKANEDRLLPWVITMDRDSQKLLAIRRNWKESDQKQRKRLWFSHKRFLPGFGFYGYGFTHIMAGLSRTQTGALRALLDAGAIDNHGGGFIARDARVALDSPLGMGEWRSVEATAEELAKAFFARPKSKPSEVLFKLLGYLDEMQQRVAATTETQVGDAPNNAPVGTTLALIEQGAKKETAIRHGLHVANAEEFGILAEMDAEFLPEIYPYAVEGDDMFIMRSDFDDRIDIRPVSDPRLATQTQRIAQQQAVMQLAAQSPQLYDLREVHRRMLEIMRVQDIDDVLLPKQETKRMEPVEEGMALLTGKPIKVFADQDHTAHLLVHDTWFGQLPPEFQQQLTPVFMAHKAEHLAWTWRLQMQQAMGMELPYPHSMADAEENEEKHPEGISIEQEQTIEALAAHAVQLMALQQDQADQQALITQQATIQAKANHQQIAKEQQFNEEQNRLDEEAVREIRRNNLIAQAEREQKAADNQAERIRQAEAQFPQE